MGTHVEKRGSIAGRSGEAQVCKAREARSRGAGTALARFAQASAGRRRQALERAGSGAARRGRAGARGAQAGARADARGSQQGRAGRTAWALGSRAGQGCALGALSLFSTRFDSVLFLSRFLDVVREPGS